MSISPVHSAKPVTTPEDSSQKLLLLLLGLGIPWGVWCASIMFHNGQTQILQFVVMVGCFILLMLGYLGLHGIGGLVWYSVPVLLTLDNLVEFVGIPSWRIAMGSDVMDSLYVKAMVLNLIGMICFWLGSLSAKKNIRIRFMPGSSKTSRRVAVMSTILMLLGLGGKLIMWKAGLYSYLADPAVLESSLWFIHWLVLLGNLLTLAVVVTAIEVFGKPNSSYYIRAILALSLLITLCFGVISGMKYEMLLPLLYMVIIYVLINKRLPRFIYLFALLPLVIYPFENAYRYNLQHGYSARANTIEGIQELLTTTIEDVFIVKAENTRHGMDDTTSRLSTLTYLRDTLSLPDPSVIQGTEKIWLAPFYPFIPRVLWPDKPIFNKGVRLSVALGRPPTTSSSVTTVGDLYTMYGTFGVAAGLFIYGVVLQLYMNWVARQSLSERQLFFYILMLFSLFTLGAYVVELITNAIQLGLFYLLISYLVYGWSTTSQHTGHSGPSVPSAAGVDTKIV